MLKRIWRWWMIGDCGRRGCGHSVAYHLPFAGCIKCDCEEYQ
jgi:hypothetical protein